MILAVLFSLVVTVASADEDKKRQIALLVEEVDRAEAVYTEAVKFSLKLKEEELSRRGVRASVDSQIKRAETEKQQLDLLSEFRWLLSEDEEEDARNALVEKKDIRGLIKAVVDDVREVEKEKAALAKAKRDLVIATETPEQRVAREAAEKKAAEDLEKHRDESLAKLKAELEQVAAKVADAEAKLNRVTEHRKTLDEISSKREKAKRPSLLELVERAKSERLQLIVLKEIDFLFDKDRLAEIRDEIRSGKDLRDVLTQAIQEVSDMRPLISEVDELKARAELLQKEMKELGPSE